MLLFVRPAWENKTKKSKWKETPSIRSLLHFKKGDAKSIIPPGNLVRRRVEIPNFFIISIIPSLQENARIHVHQS